MFRYRNRNSGQIVESVERRHDLEGVARWAAVEGPKVEAVEPAVEAEASAVEVEEPKKPARRTRAKKTTEPEVED